MFTTRDFILSAHDSYGELVDSHSIDYVQVSDASSFPETEFTAQKVTEQFLRAAADVERGKRFLLENLKHVVKIINELSREELVVPICPGSVELFEVCSESRRTRVSSQCVLAGKEQYLQQNILAIFEECLHITPIPPIVKLISLFTVKLNLLNWIEVQCDSLSCNIDSDSAAIVGSICHSLLTKFLNKNNKLIIAVNTVKNVVDAFLFETSEKIYKFPDSLDSLFMYQIMSEIRKRYTKSIEDKVPEDNQPKEGKRKFSVESSNIDDDMRNFHNKKKAQNENEVEEKPSVLLPIIKNAETSAKNTDELLEKDVIHLSENAEKFQTVPSELLAQIDAIKLKLTKKAKRFTKNDILETAQVISNLLKASASFQQGGLLLVCEALDLESNNVSDELYSDLCTLTVTPSLGLNGCFEFAKGILLPCARGLVAPASRVLVTGISTVAKQRPQAIIEGLIIPLMSSISTPPNSAQCELCLRLARQALSPYALPDLLCALCDPLVLWNDLTIPVITSLLGMKLSLDRAVVDKIVERLETEGIHEIQADSLKFATLTHTLILRYGNLVKSHFDVLRKLAEKSNVFMGKSCLSALERLKS